VTDGLRKHMVCSVSSNRPDAPNYDFPSKTNPWPKDHFSIVSILAYLTQEPIIHPCAFELKKSNWCLHYGKRSYAEWTWLISSLCHDYRICIRNTIYLCSQFPMWRITQSNCCKYVLNYLLLICIWCPHSTSSRNECVASVVHKLKCFYSSIHETGKLVSSFKFYRLRKYPLEAVHIMSQ